MDWVDGGFSFGSTSANEPEPEPFFSRKVASDTLTNRFLYKGGIYVTILEDFGDPDEILKWIKENLPKEIVIGNKDEIYCVLKFKTTEAFMAYKLRWI